MSKKVLIIVSNTHVIGPLNRRTDIFLPKVAHPYAETDREKYQIDFASLTGQNPASAKGVAEKMVALLESTPSGVPVAAQSQ